MDSNFFTDNTNISVGSGVLSVTDLNTYVESILSNDTNLRGISVEGEISGFKRYASGHCYFTLKDTASSVSCVMFKGFTTSLTFTPRDGMRVVLSGYAALYPRDGRFQFYAQSMHSVGDGELYAAFLQLKDKLESEGLFDPSRKKALPLLPRAVGIATSRSGAVFHDIINVSRRRFPNMNIIIAPCSVQGTSAPAEICASLRLLDNSDLCDVIIVGRGGGSMEDLWCFNDESVARTIASCRKPVISAVGHETDFTIADFVADMRAPTPSAAAELAVPEYDALMFSLQNMEILLADTLDAKLDRAEQRIRMAEAVLRSPKELFGVYEARLSAAGRMLSDAVNTAIEAKKQKLQSLASELSALSPLLPLTRGYAMVKADSGAYITSGEQLRKVKRAKIVFYDGEVSVTVSD